MTLAERIAAELHRVSTDRYMFGLFGDGRMGSGGFGKLQILGKTKHVTRCQNCGRAGLKHAVVCAVVGEDGHPTNQYYYFGTDCAARLAGKAEKDVEAEAEHQESSGRPRMKNLKPAKPNDGQMELGLRFAAYLHDLMTERYARAKASKGQMGFDFDSLASAPQAPAPAAAPAKPAVSEPPALPVKGKQMGLFDQPEQPKTVASGNATNWDAMSLADKLAWQKSNGKTRPDGTAAPAITKPQATPKVNLSGAVYEFVGHNENGTIRVRNDQGDEFDSQPGEQWKQHGEHPVPSSPAKAGGWNEEKHPRWEAGDKQHHGGQFAPKEHKPHKHGELESAENVLERVKSSPNQPKQRDWGRYASQFGIEGDFKHVDVPADQLKAMIASGHLRTSQSIDPDEVGKKARSGQRNPVVITNEPGKSGLVVDGNHSLQAALKAGDGKVKAIVPVSHALAAVSPKESKQQSHKAIYNGKEIDADDFKQAANRVHVNLKSGEHGYVRTPEGKLFEIAADKKMAVPVDAMRSKEQRDISLMEERVGKAQSPQEKAVLSKRLDEMKAAVAPKESKSELAIDNPPFRDFRYVPKHRNAGSLYPNRPGQLFTDEQQQQLKNWARQNGMMVSSDSGPGAIHVVHNDHRSRLDLTLHGAEGVKREAAAVKSKQAAEQESARKQQANADLAGREAAGFINEAFGDSLNTYNKTKLADFLEGKDKKFGGLWSRAHAESLQKLGAIDSTGQVNFDAIRKAFEQHGKAATASGPQEPAKPDLQAIAAEARAAGGNLWVTAKKHGIGITHPQASELAKVFQGMGEAEKPQPGPGQLRGQAKFAETRAQEEPKAEPSHLQALRGLVGDEHYGKIAGEFDRAFREFDSLPQEKKNLEFRANETRSKSLQTELGAKITYAGLRVGLLGDGMEKLARGIKQIEDGQKPGQEPKAAEGHEPYEHERYPGKWLVPSKAGVRGFGDTLHSSKDEAIAESHRVASRLKSQQEATAKAESQEKAGADRKAAFKASGLTPAQAALQARVQAHLGQQVSAQGNVTTRQALLDKELAEGHKPTMREVPDEAARAKAAKEAEFMLKRGVPTGNESHPDTIKLRELQAKAKSAMKQEHVMEKGDGVYRPLSKMEHDYAAAKYQPKAEPAASPQPAQSVTAAPSGLPAQEEAADQSVGGRVAAAIAKRSMDFGRKVEVRKDRAKKLGPRENADTAEPAEQVEGWARRYKIAKIDKSRDKSEEGKYAIYDARTKSRYTGMGHKQATRRLFESEEEAKAALPLLEVARNHDVAQSRDGKTYEIRRKFDRHSAVVKGGFASREEAARFMATNPREIINHKFPSYETYQYLDRVERKGPERRKGEVNEQDFQRAFVPGGAVFGNWMTNKDGVTAFHHAYDSLHDLADVLEIDPQQVSLDGDLVYGFGAAGSGGKNAARAHYEPGQRLINLTKMAGAGSLAHEWWHALDHFMAKHHQLSDHTAIGSHSYKMKGDAGLKKAIQDLEHALHNTSEDRVIEAHDKAQDEKDEKRKSYRADLRQKSIENKTEIPYAESVADHLHNLRVRRDSLIGWKKKAPAPELLKQYDELEQKIANGDHGDEVHVPGKGQWSIGTRTYANIKALDDVHKKITGRSFLAGDASSYSPGKELYTQFVVDKAAAKEKAERAAKVGQTEKVSRSSTFLREAAELDRTRASRYYTLPEEMGARAFEAYIADKLNEKGIRSDYLIGKGKTDNAIYRAVGLPGPFPEGEERKQINAAFDKLLSEVRKHLRKPETERHSLADEARELSQRVQRIVERYSTAPQLPGFVARVTDTSNPEHDNQNLGSAAWTQDGHLNAIHVTNNHAGALKALQAGDVTSHNKDSHEDLGAGLYASAVPHFWRGRATNRWSFIPKLTTEQVHRLADHAIGELQRNVKSGYNSESEANPRIRELTDLKAGKIPADALQWVADQPYNIDLANPRLLKEHGIDPGQQPEEVHVKAQGKFAELKRHITPEERKQLEGLGFHGAYITGGMHGNPQVVIWDHNAIKKFGGYEHKPQPKPATDLLGQPVKPASKPKAVFDSTKGKQQTLFAGLNAKEGQMNLFADAGVPDDLVAKPQQPAQKELFSAIRDALVERYDQSGDRQPKFRIDAGMKAAAQQTPPSTKPPAIFGAIGGLASKAGNWLQDKADKVAGKIGGAAQKLDQKGQAAMAKVGLADKVAAPAKPKSSGVKAGAPLMFNGDHSINGGQTSIPKGTQGKLVGPHQDPKNVVVDVGGQHHVVPKSLLLHDLRHTDHKAVEKSKQEAQQAQADQQAKVRQMTARQRAEAVPDGAGKAKLKNMNIGSHELQVGDIVNHSTPGLHAYGRVLEVSPDGKKIKIEEAARSKGSPGGIATTGRHVWIDGHEKIGDTGAVGTRSFPVLRTPDEYRPIGERKEYKEAYEGAKKLGLNDDQAHEMAMQMWDDLQAKNNPKPQPAPAAQQPAQAQPQAAQAKPAGAPKPRHHAESLQAGDTLRMLKGSDTGTNLKFIGRSKQPGMVEVEHPTLGRQTFRSRDLGLYVPGSPKAAGPSFTDQMKKGYDRSSPDMHTVKRSEFAGQKHGVLAKDQQGRGFLLYGGKKFALQPNEFDGKKLIGDNAGVKIRERIHREQIQALASKDPSAVPSHVREEYDHHWDKWSGNSSFAKSGGKPAQGPAQVPTAGPVNPQMQPAQARPQINPELREQIEEMAGKLQSDGVDPATAQQQALNHFLLADAAEIQQPKAMFLGKQGFKQGLQAPPSRVKPAQKPQAKAAQPQITPEGQAASPPPTQPAGAASAPSGVNPPTDLGSVPTSFEHGGTGRTIDEFISDMGGAQGRLGNLKKLIAAGRNSKDNISAWVLPKLEGGYTDEKLLKRIAEWEANGNKQPQAAAPKQQTVAPPAAATPAAKPQAGDELMDDWRAANPMPRYTSKGPGGPGWEDVERWQKRYHEELAKRQAAQATAPASGGSNAPPQAAKPQSPNLRALVRPYQAGRNTATIQFADELQRDLHDYAAAQGRRRQFSGKAGGQQPRQAAQLESALNRIAADHFGGDKDAAHLAALQTLAHVKAHMRGVGDGQHKIIPPTSAGLPAEPQQPATATATNTGRLTKLPRNPTPRQAEQHVNTMVNRHMREFAAQEAMHAQKLVNAWKVYREKMGIPSDRRFKGARDLKEALAQGADSQGVGLKNFDVWADQLHKDFPWAFSDRDGSKDESAIFDFFASDPPAIPKASDPELQDKFWAAVTPEYKKHLEMMRMGEVPLEHLDLSQQMGDDMRDWEAHRRANDNFSAFQDALVERFSVFWQSSGGMNGRQAGKQRNPSLTV